MAPSKRPLVPTLRGVTTIRDKKGITFGLMIIDMDVRPLFSKIANAHRNGGILYITDTQGRYLSHPDPAMAFAFELGNPHKLQNDFPMLAGLLHNVYRTDGALSTKLYHLNTQAYYVAARRVRFDIERPERFVLLAYMLPESKLQDETSYFHENIIIGTLLSLLIILPLLFCYCLHSTSTQATWSCRRGYCTGA